MEAAVSHYELNPINEFCNTENDKLLHNRIAEMDIVQRVEAASMSQMYSFWREIQETLIASAEEIKRLRARVAELETQLKKSDTSV
jgi:hypothetical protein